MDILYRLMTSRVKSIGVNDMTNWDVVHNEWNIKEADCKIATLREQIGVLEADKNIYLHRILRIKGTCDLCQNGHWPHCSIDT